MTLPVTWPMLHQRCIHPLPIHSLIISLLSFVIRQKGIFSHSSHEFAMFKNTILNAFVNQSFPNKCHTLNAVLEECNPKDCCSSFEMIVNCLFSSTTKINYICTELGYSSNLEHRIAWPLKLVTRSQYNLEYDCIFRFLNSSSVFWLTIFRLDSMGLNPTSLQHSVL